jgi:hypothetical protein
MGPIGSVRGPDIGVTTIAVASGPLQRAEGGANTDEGSVDVEHDIRRGVHRSRGGDDFDAQMLETARCLVVELRETLECVAALSDRVERLERTLVG